MFRVVYTLHVFNVHTVFTLHIFMVYTVFTLYIFNVYMGFTLHIFNVYMVFTLHIFNVLPRLNSVQQSHLPTTKKPSHQISFLTVPVKIPLKASFSRLICNFKGGYLRNT